MPSVIGFFPTCQHEIINMTEFIVLKSQDLKQLFGLRMIFAHFKMRGLGASKVCFCCSFIGIECKKHAAKITFFETYILEDFSRPFCYTYATKKRPSNVFVRQSLVSRYQTESNRRKRFCRPSPNHSAMIPFICGAKIQLFLIRRTFFKNYFSFKKRQDDPLEVVLP